MAVTPTSRRLLRPRHGRRDTYPATMWPFRRKAQPVRQEHSNPVRIAVLEHDLLGIPPAPGSMAAAVVALRQGGTCIEHSPVEVTELGSPGPTALCTRCGNHLVMDQQGRWRTA